MIDLSSLPAGAVERFRSHRATLLDLHHIGLEWGSYATPDAMARFIAAVAGGPEGLSSLMMSYIEDEAFAPVYEWHVFCYGFCFDANSVVSADRFAAEAVAAAYETESAEDAVSFVVTVAREHFAKGRPQEATHQLVKLYKLIERAALESSQLAYMDVATAVMSIASVFVSGPTRSDPDLPLIY